MLRRPADSNDLVIVKLRRKLEYKGQVVSESVRPALAIQFLEFFRSHNHLHWDISINPGNVTVDVLDSQTDELDKNEICSELLRCTGEPIEIKVESAPGKELQKIICLSLEDHQLELQLFQRFHQHLKLSKELLFYQMKGNN